jgi:hypothetical protein
MVQKDTLPMQAQNTLCSIESASKPTWKPICCGQDMAELVRRMILGQDGHVSFCSVWNCGVCGRLLL